MDYFRTLSASLAHHVARVVSPSVAGAVGLVLLSVCLRIMFSRPKWNVEGKHCVVTGGSSGLGLALSKLLLSKGANVTIIARNQTKLDEALVTLKAGAPSMAQVHAISSDVSTADGARAGISQACEPFGGKMADAVFLCAGASTPGFFIEQEDSLLIKSMDTDYWTACWTAKAAARQMAKQAASFVSPPKIVFVSSTLGLMTIPGYASYSPAKHAIRGLSDTLRSELKLFGIEVHCFFPAGILSPGFEEENKTKPQLTKTIEGSDEPSSPEACAGYLVRGIEKGEYQISYDLATSIFRASTRGIAPYNTVVLDLLLAFIGSFGIPAWRMWADGQVRSEKARTAERLKASGFFDSV